MGGATRDQWMRGCRGVLILGLITISQSCIRSPSGKSHEEEVVRAYTRSLWFEGGLRDPRRSGRNPAAVYMFDDRRDLSDLDVESEIDQKLRELSTATCLITWTSNVNISTSGSISLMLSEYQGYQEGIRTAVCSSERYASQLSGGWCTGFLVASDVVATAGHCIEGLEQLQRVAFVFGYRIDSNGLQNSFTTNDIFYGKEMIDRASFFSDYCLVRLDRVATVTGRKIMKVRVSGTPTESNRVGIIGYPSGLPVKVAFGEYSRLVGRQRSLLRANVDAFGGNSGSPLINADADYVVDGILVRGSPDFEYDPEEQCLKETIYKNEYAGEYGTRTTRVKGLMKLVNER